MLYYKPESLVEKHLRLRVALLFNPAIYGMTVGFGFLANRLKTEKLRCCLTATDSHNSVIRDHYFFHVISRSDTIISISCLISSLDIKESKDEKFTISLGSLFQSWTIFGVKTVTEGVCAPFNLKIPNCSSKPLLYIITFPGRLKICFAEKHTFLF